MRGFKIGLSLDRQKVYNQFIKSGVGLTRVVPSPEASGVIHPLVVLNLCLLP